MVASAPELTVGVLGPLQVAVDGVEAQVPAGNQRRLLASLLLGRSRVVPAQRLVEDVWGLEPPEATHASLHTTVARLRRSLGPAGQRVGIGPGGYALDVTDRYRDDGRFVHLLTAAREARGEERVGQLDQALALWRGDAWQEFRDDLAAAEARQLEEMRWQAWGNLAEAMTEVGRVDEAVSWLRGLVSRRPLHERTVGLLVEALDRAGAVQEALAEYAGFRERLAEQMGLDPSPRLAELHARVLRRERSSEALVLTGPGSPGETPASFGSVPPAGAPLGREDLIAMVLDRLQRESLVTLVGPGGVGKTTVAAAVAGRAEEAWWVDLMAVAPGDDLLELLVTQTGGRAGVGTDSAELLEQRLATARGLLVLDNCEHLVDGLADLVAQVLHGAPEVRVLATSRHRLGVAGERILPVPPLRVEGGGPEDPPAVALFLQRAAEVEPGLVVDSRARGAAAGICRRLDGLPLAIELAAGQAGSVSLTDLATHLAEQVDLLHATGHAGHERPRRHQTLRDTMRWSYDLLDPVEQQVFRGLGVFAAEFELAAAQLVVSALGVEHGRVAVVVADLVRRSMVVAPSPVGTGGYRLLDTLRVFARDLVDDRERTTLARAHEEWVRRVVGEAAEGLPGPSEAAWARRVRALLPDVRAVFTSALTQDPPLAEHLAVSLGRWGYHSLDSELLGLSERVLARQDQPSAAILVFSASAAWLRGDYGASAALARRALAVAEGATPVWHLAHEALADAAVSTGDPSAAVEHYRAGVDLTVRAVRWAEASVMCGGLALALAYAGKDGSAEVEEALGHARRSQNPTALAFAWYVDGEVRGDRQPEAALAAFDRAQQVDVGPVASLSHSVARTAAAALLGRVGALTSPTFEQVAGTVEHWSDLGQTGILVTCLRNTIPLLVRAGDHEVALQVGEALRRTPTEHASYGTEAEVVRRSLGEAADHAGREVSTSGGWLDLVDAARLAVEALRRHVIPAETPA